MAILYTSTDIMGYQVYYGSLENIQLNGQKKIINTLNAHSYAVAKKDKAFAQALKSSTVILPDGMPVVLASRILRKNHEMKKIAGHDLFLHFMKSLNETGGKCFFLGSTEETLQKIVEKAAKEYPRVRIKTFSPPFRPFFSCTENTKILESVNAFAPDVLFVGMTAPKQEKWIEENNRFIRAWTICAIGAVFDFYAGTVKRPDPFWVRLGLEWFIRLIKEPRRLWKRYLVSSPVFFIDLFWNYIKQKPQAKIKSVKEENSFNKDFKSATVKPLMHE